MILPNVPPGLDHKLDYFLEQLRTGLLKITTTIEEQEQSNGLPTAGESVSNVWVPVTPSELVDEASGTEGAWTNISAGAPAGTTMIRAIINMSGGTALAKFRKASGEPEIEVQSGADTRYSVITDIPLASDGTFDYYVEAAMVTWSYVYIGYLGVA